LHVFILVSKIYSARIILFFLSAENISKWNNTFAIDKYLSI